MKWFQRIAAKLASSKIKTVLSSYFTGFDAETFGENVAGGAVLLKNLQLKPETVQASFPDFEITKGLHLSNEKCFFSSNPFNSRIYWAAPDNRKMDKHFF